MKRSSITLVTLAGVLILAASTNAMIEKTGGYFTSHALLVSGLTFGVFAASWCLGKGVVAPKLAAIVIPVLVAGELYNFGSMAERIVIVREEAQARLRGLAEKHNTSVERLSALEKREAGSPRLTLAKAALADSKPGGGESQRVRVAREQAEAAQTAVDQEAANISCRKECERKQSVARGKASSLTAALNDDASDRQATVSKAETEVATALTEAMALREADIKAAKADVAANPAPASATPLADRTGMPAWVLDLSLAALLSFAANGLAACLVAIGARQFRTNARPTPKSRYVPPSQSATVTVRGYSGPDRANKSVARGRPSDNCRPAIRRGPDRPVRWSGGLTKSEALDDLMQRLSDSPIFSQKELALAWGRPKQTVSDWMREWRRIGVMPETTPAGRCTVPAIAENSALPPPRRSAH